MSLPSSIIFGPQIGVPSPEYLSYIRASLLRDTNAALVVQIVSDLPDLWDLYTKSQPAFNRIPGRQLLGYICQWIREDKQIPFQDSPPNILLAPLTVITQAVEYFEYLRITCKGCPHADVVKGLHENGFQGLCIGLLTAIALSSARDQKNAVAQVGVALRLAVMIGAVVDVNGRYADPPRETSCVVARLRGRSSTNAIQQILKSHDETFITITSDPSTCTITTPSSEIQSVTEDLVREGVSVRQLDLRGRFHSSVHSETAQALHKLCNAHESLRFCSDQNEGLFVRSGVDGKTLETQSLHQQAINEILLWPCRWDLVLSHTLPNVRRNNGYLVSVGLTNPIPSSTAREHDVEIVHVCNNASDSSPSPRIHSTSAIAVIGMGCKFPGASSINDFWNLLRSGCAMASEIPVERFQGEAPDSTTSVEKEVFWGNLVEDMDRFDHKFFSKSSREASAMDPQQRMLLEVAYQALESAGWFGIPGAGHVKQDVGCFIGCGSSDYNDNSASHRSSAFSILGALRGMLSGRISHHFGWEGPSITYDTACASSMVAIHAACKALQVNECKAAVAGGVNALTSPNYYRHLDAAGFLGKEGASKAFDAKADGYCRGEGVGIVVLKRLDDALAHGDRILGVVAGSKINQNDNKTPINVPSQASQTKLFRSVLRDAQIDAVDISFVEAHGTGTQVGDCIEAESIREVFKNPDRPDHLRLGSVKDSIGHTEGAAGVAGLIKVLLMIQHGVIVPQAGFATLNPNIPPLKPDGIKIPRKVEPWRGMFKAACVNNYGAGGCNGALIACQPPTKFRTRNRPDHRPLQRYPIYISAKTPASLKSYCSALEGWLCSQAPDLHEEDVLPSVAFTLSRRQNRNFHHHVSFSTSSLRDLCDQLKRYSEMPVDQHAPVQDSEDTPRRKPVVLVFGGQTGRLPTLSSDFIGTCTLLRRHLEDCNTALKKLGYNDLFSAISSRRDVRDLASAHGILFSIQYATAKCWLDCGLKVDALIGHSFGQLTALCISGVLSLEDALKLTVGRAALMEENWGPDPGSMVAIEADSAHLSQIVELVNRKMDEIEVEVACYNGPTSFVLAGTVPSIKAVEYVVATTPALANDVKLKKLETPYGFHSRLTEPVLQSYLELVQSITFNSATIPIETCTDGSSWPDKITAGMVAQHTRGPVFFHQAIIRLHERLGACAWLEAGTSSPIIGMVRRAVGESVGATHIFQPVNFEKASNDLAAVTAALWKERHIFCFWPFHSSQANEYLNVELPPYQFERARHWLPYVDIRNSKQALLHSGPVEPQFCSFERYSDSDRKISIFNIDARSERFSLLVQGHAVLGIPLCPASAYTDIAAHAAFFLANTQNLIPCFTNLEIHAPLSLNEGRNLVMTLTRVEHTPYSWTFELTSTQNRKSSICHASGNVLLDQPGGEQNLIAFSSFQRLVDGGTCTKLLEDRRAQAIHGTVLYALFGKTVVYEPYYRGVKRIASVDGEVAAIVTLPPNKHKSLSHSVCDPLAIDNFLQVAGIHVNFLQESLHEETFVATRIESILFETTNAISQFGETWQVYSKSSRKDERTFINDIFVFGDKPEKLVLVLSGVHFSRVRNSTFLSILSRARGSSGRDGEENVKPTIYLPQNFSNSASNVGLAEDDQIDFKTLSLRKLLSEILDIPEGSLSKSTTFDDLGIDSLMVTEVANGIRETFHVIIPTAELQMIGDIGHLAARLFGTTQMDMETSALSTPSDVSSNSWSGAEIFPNTAHSIHSTSTMASSVENDALAMGSANDVPAASAIFESMKAKFDLYAAETGFKGYLSDVYPLHLQLVTAYIVEAFTSLNVPLKALAPDTPITQPAISPRHQKLFMRLLQILEDLGIIREAQKGKFMRTAQHIESTSASELHKIILDKFPAYRLEHQLLHITGSQFSDCLTGNADAVDLLFGTKENRTLLEDVYSQAPVFITATKLLSDFLVQYFKASSRSDSIQILEIGAGTGGTTKFLLDKLLDAEIDFIYTFTDISSSLVAQAKKKFGHLKNVRFRVLDIEKEVPAELCGQYQTVISTNCIHATANLVASCSNLRKMLKVDGFLTLAELTRKMAWFDLVFGLLEGWWAFADSRVHALVDESVWDDTLRISGFTHVDWSSGKLEESGNLRIICGFNNLPDASSGTKISIESTASASSVLIQGDIDSSEHRVTIFAFPGGFGTAATYTPLPVLHPCVTFVALNSPFLDNPSVFDLPLADLTLLYLAEIRRLQPSGPYTLLGYSVGGVMAYEAARQLLAQGEEIRQLILIDSACPALIPPFPLSLLDFFDGIDRFKGTGVDTNTSTGSDGQEKESANRAKKMNHPHVVATLRSLHRYKPLRIPRDLSPQTLLLAARYGVDQRKAITRPNVNAIEQTVIQWVLDDRQDFSASGFGWDRLIDAEKIVVIPVEGNHFSLMTDPFIRIVASEMIGRLRF